VRGGGVHAPSRMARGGVETNVVRQLRIQRLSAFRGGGGGDCAGGKMPGDCHGLHKNSFKVKTVRKGEGWEGEGGGGTCSVPAGRVPGEV